MIENAMAVDTVATGGGFEAWCKCVRRLLDCDDGPMESWRALYSSGHTPRDAARLSVFGEGLGD